MRIQYSIAAVLALSACGGSSSGVSPSAVTAYQRSALSASTAVTAYQSATETMTTPAQCQAAAQQYATQMGAAVQSMRQLAGSMDQHMQSMGQADAADMSCGADVMAQELQQHLGVACSSADMTQNRTVAAQHSQQMIADADHLQMRAAGMAAMIGDGGVGGGMMGDGGSGMMTAAGMSAAMDTMMTAGFTAPDGQHLTWSQPMQGCTFSGGSYQVSATVDGGTPATAPATTPAG